MGVIHLSNDKEAQRAIPFDDTLQEFAGTLDGHALMGPLFGVPSVLFEGDDDYRIWSQIPRNTNFAKLFSVIPCDGEKVDRYSKSLNKVLSALLDPSDTPSPYVIRDGDMPAREADQESQIGHLRLACQETENLYLTDEVLPDLA